MEQWWRRLAQVRESLRAAFLRREPCDLSILKQIPNSDSSFIRTAQLLIARLGDFYHI
jgi:hypothetical protein